MAAIGYHDAYRVGGHLPHFTALCLLVRDFSSYVSELFRNEKLIEVPSIFGAYMLRPPSGYATEAIPEVIVEYACTKKKKK